MDWSGGESQEQHAEPRTLPPFPRIWIGYLLGAATLIAEMIAITMHPELAKEPLLIPPLYLFLANFISLVYWLVIVYEYHVVLAQATAGAYPIKPLRAAGFQMSGGFAECYILALISVVHPKQYLQCKLKHYSRRSRLSRSSLRSTAPAPLAT